MKAGCRVTVLISGNGSNLQTLIDQQARGELPIRLQAVISNRDDAHGLQRATDARIPSLALSHKQYGSRDEYDAALAQAIDSHGTDLLVLAGFMRILTPDFVLRYQGRMLNIHPSLLPAYRGLHTHRRVLEQGDSQHGCSVHFVTPDLDAGPIVLQARVPVGQQDTEETLAARVQAEEHRIYPLAVRWFAQGRLALRNGAVHLDGSPLPAPLVLGQGDPLPH